MHDLRDGIAPITAQPTASTTENVSPPTASALLTYSNQEYGLEVKYPASLATLGNNNEKIILSLGKCGNEGDMCEDVLSISVKSNMALDEWYARSVKQLHYGSSSPHFKDVIINGLSARKILDPRDSFYRGGSPCYVTAIYSNGKIFEICDNLNNEVTQSIIGSFVIK